jgi:N-formylglutamate amidohydrolase
VVNGRFIGGYITRAYGKPSEGLHAVQMEIGQDCHLIGGSTQLDRRKSQQLRDILQRLADAMIAWRG